MFRWLFGDSKAQAAKANRFGAYAVRRTVHDGEKAMVFEARSLTTHHSVAIKAYKPLYDRTARRMRKKYSLRSEGEIGMLMNPRVEGPRRSYPVVRTLHFGNEFGKSGSPAFIVMEYVRGAKLKSMIATRDPNLPRMRVHICRQALHALMIVHSRRMAHRDICSDNFLVSPKGELKLIDLGFCVPFGLCFEEKSGTPSYMSPEQIQAAQIVPQSDIYSFGVVMFELFTGRLPFQTRVRGGSDGMSRARAAEIMAMHLRDPPPEPRSLVPELNPKIEEIILKCLDKMPARRFATAEELLCELNRLGSVDQ
jgi:serine/threonine-protein kinase